jgi:hypothetical protein
MIEYFYTFCVCFKVGDVFSRMICFHVEVTLMGRMQ